MAAPLWPDSVRSDECYLQRSIKFDVLRRGLVWPSPPACPSLHLLLISHSNICERDRDTFPAAIFHFVDFLPPSLRSSLSPPLQRSAAPLLHRNNESCLRLVFLFHSVFFHTVLLPHAKCPSSVQTGKTVIITSWSLSVIILRQKQQWWRVFWKPQGLSSPANKGGHFTWGRRLGQSPKKPFRQSKWKCERVQIVWQPTRFLHNPRKMWTCPFVSVGAVYMLWGQV